MATPFCSDSAILTNRHYKSNAFLTPEHGRGPPTMENVAYSDFVKMMKNANLLRMLTRATSVPTPNSAGSTFSSLAAVSSPFLQNVLESLTRHVLLDSIIFRACTNKLLVLVSCRFVNFEHFIRNHPSLQKCLGASPQLHFWFAPARAAFEMLLWLMNCCETLAPALGFCCDFL